MVEILLDANRTTYRPGETIQGTVHWALLDPPESVELRLFWFTRGKGTEDVKLIESTAFDAPGAEERRPFLLRLPGEPYSFSGRLISLIWALELVAKPGGDTARAEITVSPAGDEIKLYK